MRFQKGIGYTGYRRPRGRGRGCYSLSDAALAARRHNLGIAEARGRLKRLRCHDETLIIKLLVWQTCFGQEPRPSLRTLARQLGVSHVYVHKVLRKATSVGWATRVQCGRRVNLDDLEKACQFTAKLREQGLLALPCRLYEGEPHTGRWRLAGAMTADEIIAEQRAFAEEWKRKNASR
jgi:hypothetical protein